MKLGTLLLGIIAFFAIRYALREGVRSVVTSATTDHAAKCLVMLGHTTSFQDGSTFIVGSFKNNCDRRFSHVTVAFMLDRSSGTSVTQMWSPLRSSTAPNRAPQTALDLPAAPIFAYSRDIQPGETRKFKSAMPISENSTFRFDRISGY